MAAPIAVVRGGGELGTGAAHALALRGLRILVVDRPVPSALRLGVAFATAAVRQRITVEEVEAVLCAGPGEVDAAWGRGRVAVWTRGEAELAVEPAVIVDARMRRLTARLTERHEAPVVVGIGPGFEAGEDVHYVVESERGPRLGQVIAHGQASRHSGVPGEVAGYREERILRAPVAGTVTRLLELGDFVERGDVVATVGGEPARARLRGMVRGLKMTGVPVGAGHKLGDVDPRRDRSLLTTMTDKSKAVGRGVVRALELGGLLPVGADPPPWDALERSKADR